MKKTEKIKATYYEHENFIVTIEETEEGYSACLQENGYGIKEYMFGVSKAGIDKDGFLKMVSESVEEYARLYLQNREEEESGNTINGAVVYDLIPNANEAYDLMPFGSLEELIDNNKYVNNIIKVCTLIDGKTNKRIFVRYIYTIPSLDPCYNEKTEKWVADHFKDKEA